MWFMAESSTYYKGLFLPTAASCKSCCLRGVNWQNNIHAGCSNQNLQNGFIPIEFCLLNIQSINKNSELAIKDYAVQNNLWGDGSIGIMVSWQYWWCQEKATEAGTLLESLKTVCQQADVRWPVSNSEQNPKGSEGFIPFIYYIRECTRFKNTFWHSRQVATSQSKETLSHCVLNYRAYE